MLNFIKFKLKSKLNSLREGIDDFFMDICVEKSANNRKL